MPRGETIKESRHGKNKIYNNQIDPLSLPGSSNSNLTNFNRASNSISRSSHKASSSNRPDSSGSNPVVHSLPSSSLYTFNPGQQCWSTTNQFPVEPLESISTLKVLTYNTWSCSPTHSHYQESAIFQILKENQLDIICLQEVSTKFGNRLREQNFIGAEYSMTGLNDYFRAIGNIDSNGKGKMKEGVVVLIRKGLIGRGSSVQFVRLNCADEERGKGLVILKLYRGGKECVRIISSHFTSLPTNATIRQAQYTTALHHMSPQTSSPLFSLLLADFNNSNEEEMIPFHPNLLDAHQSFSTDLLHASPTFGELYPFFPGKNSKRRKMKRVDRILFRGYKSCENYYTVGEQPLVKHAGNIKLKDKTGLDGLVYASDHLGVVCTLTS